MSDAGKAIISSANPSRDPPTAAEMDSFSGDPHFMLSLARGLLVLQAFVLFLGKVVQLAHFHDFPASLGQFLNQPLNQP
jgi:hypothetical protein